MPLGAFKAGLMGAAGVSGDPTAPFTVLLSTQTADGDSTVSFTSGITSAYGEYIFTGYNIGPATDNALIKFQVNASGEEDYDEVMTTTQFQAWNAEAGGNTGLGYNSGQNNGTAFEIFTASGGNGSDENMAFTLHLFNPSSTTYVKHYYITSPGYNINSESQNFYCGGYINTTAAIDEVQFKMTTGDFDGKIKMWGVK